MDAKISLLTLRRCCATTSSNSSFTCIFRGASRDDERGRKTPTKGRGGGRRGSAHSGYKRDNFMDENSNEPMEVGNMSKILL